MPANGREHQPGLCPARDFDLTSAPLESAIGAAGDGEEMIEPRKEVMLAIMPALGTLLQDVIVVVLRLFDEALQQAGIIYLATG